MKTANLNFANIVNNITSMMVVLNSDLNEHNEKVSAYAAPLILRVSDTLCMADRCCPPEAPLQLLFLSQSVLTSKDSRRYVINLLKRM